MDELVQQIIQPYLAEQPELTLWEQLQAFYHAITWSEGWIISLLLMHLTLFILVIFTRKIMVVQIPTFLSLLFLVYNSERINTMGSMHWKQFSTQDYFDPNGIFISALFSFPLLMMALIILINLVLENIRLLIKVKRAQVMINNKNNKKDGANGADTSVTSKNKAKSNEKNN